MTTRLPAFDVLVDMARNDPEGLETLRRSLTNAVIAAAGSDSTRRRLKGIQFRVDLERQRATTPLAATIRISEMMCRSLAELHASMVTPIGEQLALVPGSREPAEVVESKAVAEGPTNIIPFPRSPRSPRSSTETPLPVDPH